MGVLIVHHQTPQFLKKNSGFGAHNSLLAHDVTTRLGGIFVDF
jgi:hypothetical protein